MGKNMFCNRNQFVRQFRVVMCIFFMACTCVAQNTSKRFAVGITISPDYAYRSLTTSDKDGIVGFIVVTRNMEEIPKLGYTAGINMVYNLTKKWAVETGAFIANKGYQSDYSRVSLIFGNQIILTSGKPIKRMDFKYNDYYIDIPLKVRYTFYSKRINIYATIGAYISYFLEEKRIAYITYTDDTRETKTYPGYTDYNQTNKGILAGVGVQYFINNRFSLQAEPVFRSSIESIINAPIKCTLYSYGCQTGMFYHF